jgi:hypothetical protein
MTLPSVGSVVPNLEKAGRVLKEKLTIGKQLNLSLKTDTF